MSRSSGRRRSLRRAAEGLLADLGGSSAEVAATLTRLGARPGSPGRDMRPGMSPLASVLSAVVGADPDVARVELVGASVLIHQSSRWRRSMRVHLPHPVSSYLLILLPSLASACDASPEPSPRPRPGREPAPG